MIIIKNKKNNKNEKMMTFIIRTLIILSIYTYLIIKY
jgi:hypothetical protein